MRELHISQERFDLYNKEGDRIKGDLRFLKSLKEIPVIIICHSFMAFKDWGFFPYVAERFAEAGYVALTFNFSLNGVVGDGDRITNFEKFERNSFTREVNDLKEVLDAVWGGEVGAGIIDRSRIILFGHSRGGSIAILTASANDSVKALISWSTIGTFDRWTKHQVTQWKKLGYLPLSNDPKISPLRLGIGLLDDLENNKERLNLIRAANQINIPWLILHGKADVTVPFREAEDLFRASNHSSTELKLLDKVGHLYNASTKEEDNYQTLNKIIDLTISWIQKNIR